MGFKLFYIGLSIILDNEMSLECFEAEYVLEKSFPNFHITVLYIVVIITSGRDFYIKKNSFLVIL